MVKRLVRFVSDVTDPEQCTESELWLISFGIMLLALLALFVLMRPDMALPRMPTV